MIDENVHDMLSNESCSMRFARIQLSSRFWTARKSIAHGATWNRDKLNGISMIWNMIQCQAGAEWKGRRRGD